MSTEVNKLQSEKIKLAYQLRRKGSICVELIVQTKENVSHPSWNISCKLRRKGSNLAEPNMPTTEQGVHLS